MKKVVFIALACVLVGEGVAQELKSGPLYRCAMADHKELNSAGFLEENAAMRSASKSFTYDSISGLLRWGQDSTAWSMTEVQKGSKENDLVAIRIFHGAYTTPVELLRIRLWEPALPFLFVADGEVMTGTCKKQ